MDLLTAAGLGVVEGLTEFLPVSSTGHLTIAEKLFGLQVNADSITAFTVVIQIGAILAVVIFFARDIWSIIRAWVRGLTDADLQETQESRMGWCVIVGTIPIGIVGFAAQGVVTGPLRSLWWVAGALVVWSAVMVLAERAGRQTRHEADITLLDAVVVGIVQCAGLVPGV